MSPSTFPFPEAEVVCLHTYSVKVLPQVFSVEHLMYSNRLVNHSLASSLTSALFQTIQGRDLCHSNSGFSPGLVAVHRLLASLSDGSAEVF